MGRYGDRFPLLAPPDHGDVMKVGTLADSGAEARKSRSGSRDGLLNGSPDGWFSCSKTSDSARRSPDFQFLGITYILEETKLYVYIKFRL